MLEIMIPSGKYFDEKEEVFITIDKEKRLQLEHSLLSIKKWESKWHKPFLEDDNKSLEEIYDYIRCMTIGPVLEKNVYMCISDEDVEKILEYINDKMTATWFKKNQGNGKVFGSSVITNEIIYYWMIKLGIPMECQKWHLNQLLTLIRVVSIKEQPKKEMSKREEAQQRSLLNKQRRARLKSKG